ncbi:hypothetical protein DFP72DRAFT_861423 [Ephemerocybe angulata]|uniref:Uncharacterized protein n=1 Tax=Ephemerocybe angulata TaxID=980116 RepID=A0A8H6LV12_9AGAR|nr:hypothetical protein DFP72DRAFT_861423 [Tulosesus angulatus]
MSAPLSEIDEPSEIVPRFSKLLAELIPKYLDPAAYRRAGLFRGSRGVLNSNSTLPKVKANALRRGTHLLHPQRARRPHYLRRGGEASEVNDRRAHREESRHHRRVQPWRGRAKGGGTEDCVGKGVLAFYSLVYVRVEFGSGGVPFRRGAMRWGEAFFTFFTPRERRGGKWDDDAVGGWEARWDYGMLALPWTVRCERNRYRDIPAHRPMGRSCSFVRSVVRLGSMIIDSLDGCGEARAAPDDEAGRWWCHLWVHGWRTFLVAFIRAPGVAMQQCPRLSLGGAKTSSPSLFSVWVLASHFVVLLGVLEIGSCVNGGVRCAVLADEVGQGNLWVHDRRTVLVLSYGFKEVIRSLATGQ